MIWRGVEAEFKRTAEALSQLDANPALILAQIAHHTKAAEEHLNKMLDGTADILSGLPEIQQIFDESEIKRIRTGQTYTIRMGKKMFSASEQLALRLRKTHPYKPHHPTRNSLKNSFLYRVSLAMFLYALRWIRGGSQLPTRHDRVRNDYIDMIFATYGTYFNGLMTEDRRAGDLHAELRYVLAIQGARMPVDYLEPFLKEFREHHQGLRTTTT